MKYDNEFEINDLFVNSNTMTEYIMKEPEGYRTYLSIAAKCPHFTPANQLLIHGFSEGKIPEYLDDYDNWLNNGYSIKEDANIIHVMEKDNSSEYGYKDRKLVDVADTNAGYSPFFYDKGLVLEALMTSSPCKIEFNPDITSKAVYIPNKQVIEVSRGYKNIEQIFENLSREMVHARLHLNMLENNKNTPSNITLQYPRSRYSFMAYSVSYMLSSKYDMMPEQIEIKALPPEWNDILSSTGQARPQKEALGTFRNDVLRPLNDTFRNMDNVLGEKINLMYNQAGSEM